MLDPISKTLREKKATLPRKRKGAFFDRRIPKQILVNGFTKLPNAIILDPAMSCQDLRILLVLDFHSKNKFECWPSHQTISEEANCSLRTAKRSLKTLKKLHYVEWKNTKFTNIYTLVYKARRSKN